MKRIGVLTLILRRGLTALLLLLMVGAATRVEASSQFVNSFTRTYNWKFEGREYQLKYSIPWEVYHFYQEKPRVYHNYSVYTFENQKYAFLSDFVEALKCTGEDGGLNAAKMLQFVIAFVQQLQYQTESGEYPKFPVETLAEKGGDCEDTSILLAAILKEMGYESLLINPPGHMAIAISCQSCIGTAYNHEGKRYFYIETTAAGFSIGEVPEEYKQTKDRIFPLRADNDELWVLREFVPSRHAPAMVYYVSEDAATRLAKAQQGKQVMATTTFKTVNVNGSVSTSRSFKLYVR